MNFKTKIGHLFQLAIITSSLMGSSAWAAIKPQQNDAGVYQITSVDDLYAFANIVNGTNNATKEVSASAELTTDITVNANVLDKDGNPNSGDFKEWTPMGTSSDPYTGTFNGNGHTISGLYCSSSNSNIGLFGYISSATINGVNLVDSYISGSNENVGGICGYNNGGTITNCSNAGSITSSASEVNVSIGGICGYNMTGSITNCSNAGTITATGNKGEDVGGICGHNQSGTISDVYNTGSVKGSDYVGGICGSNNPGTIKNCYSTGTVTGTGYTKKVVFWETHVDASNANAVCGYNKNGTVEKTSCYYLSSNGSDDNATAMTSDQFASGEVAYDLQKVSKNWGQGDNLPILGGGTEDSYPATLILGTNCLGTTVYYSGSLDNGHLWGEWQATVEATCVSKAYRMRYCQYNANHSEVDSTGTVALGHDYNETGICSRCGAYQPATLNNGVYEIANAGQLYWFSSQVNSGSVINAVLTTNISLSGLSGWTPIGTSEKPYTGTFDGNGKTISGLTISTSADNVGLFGVNSGIIKNVAMIGSSISGGTNVGSICGYNYGGTIVNCYNICSVNGTKYVGGICGFNEGVVSGDNLKGGVYNCYNTGSVDGANRGGICGEYGNKATANCYSNTTDSYAASKDVDNFKSGEVAVLLQMWADKSSYSDLMNWSQTYGTDSPIFGGSSIDYTRSIPDNVWGTLCLPYMFTVTNKDLSFYNVKGVETNNEISTLVLSPTDEVTPGKPVVYYYTGTNTGENRYLKVSIPLENHKDPADLTANGMLNGVYGYSELTVDYSYYLKGNKFLKSNGSFIANPFRAYIIYDGTTQAKAVAPKAPKSLSLSVANNASNDSDEEAATVTESHIVAIYNISGQQVDMMDRGGIYLVKMSDGSTKKVRITE